MNPMGNAIYTMDFLERCLICLGSMEAGDKLWIDADGTPQKDRNQGLVARINRRIYSQSGATTAQWLNRVVDMVGLWLRATDGSSDSITLSTMRSMRSRIADAAKGMEALKNTYPDHVKCDIIQLQERLRGMADPISPVPSPTHISIRPRLSSVSSLDSTDE